MVDIYLKNSIISSKDWDKVYGKILKIVHDFPIKLARIEEHGIYEKELNKIQSNLIVNKGTKDEYIEFGSDFISISFNQSIRFYKNWGIQQEKMFGKEKDTSKPVYWGGLEPYAFSGSFPDANGMHFFNLLDPNTTLLYAILAIGIMMENSLPGRAFLYAFDIDHKTIQETTRWLEYIFNEKYNLPVYFDKMRLLSYLQEHYENKTDLAGRFDWLYTRKFKNNMSFAIKNIGYTPALEFYANYLSQQGFATFGFFDILNAWIAATKNLENTLELISFSKQILQKDKNNKKNLLKAEEYDYSYILEVLLQDYILWTPAQRKILDNFPTNRQALENNDEDLWGTMLRIAGYRIDICPIHTSKEELFEVFMYHDPKNAAKYKEIINEYYNKTNEEYERVVKSLQEIRQKQNNKIENFEIAGQKEDIENHKLKKQIEQFAYNFHESERFFIIKSLENNPEFLNKEFAISELKKKMKTLTHKNKENMIYRCNLIKSKKIENIHYWIKEKRLIVSPEFNKWLNEANDNILCGILLLVSLKIYNAKLAYARNMILLNNNHWKTWEKENWID